MTKSDLWKIYTAKNPSFDGDGNVTLTARGLRKLFGQTWDIAFFEGEPETTTEPPRSKDTTSEETTEAVNQIRQIFGF